MKAKTLMKTFLIEKGLWDEFTRYYTEVKLEGLYVKKEKLPQLVYTPRTTKTERLERNRKIKEMRDSGKTFIEIMNRIASLKKLKGVLNIRTEGIRNL